MTHHELTDPIYGASILVFVGDRERANDAIAALTKARDRPLAVGKTGSVMYLQLPDGNRGFVLWIDRRPRLGMDRLNLLHECDHLRDAIMDSVGVRYDGHNPEARAYYLTYLYRTICDTLEIRY